MTPIPESRTPRPRSGASRRLRPLLAAWEREHSWPDVEASPVHVLVDVCRCLEVPGGDVRWLLGEAAWALFVEGQSVVLYLVGDDAE